MTKLENNLIETRSDMSQEAYEQHDHHESKEAEQASSSVITNTSNMHGKIKKSVNFEASKEASMDLERIIPERCKLTVFDLYSYYFKVKNSFTKRHARDRSLRLSTILV